MINFDGESLRVAIDDMSKNLSEAVGQGPMRAAGAAGAAVFRDEAKLNASRSETSAGDGPAKRSGILQNNIIIKRLEEESSDRKQAYIVTVRSGKFGADGDAFYWRFVEFGHKFVGRNRKVSKTTGKTIGWKAHRAAADVTAEARRLEFGTAGAPAYPFMRPAYESKKQAAADVMQATLAEKVKEKLAGK
jgi:hypothetical protein